MRVAIIGSGMVGEVHLQALTSHPLVSEVHLVDAKKGRVEKLAEKYSFTYCGDDYCKVIKDTDIDLVDICLPHDLHYPITIEALRSGKHVILEKPIANSLEEADAIISASRMYGKRVFVALNERFLPVYEKVSEIVRSGKLGKIVLANLVVAGSELERMQQPDNWKGTIGRAGGGALADSGTHVVDLALNWFGMPESVNCSTGRFVVEAVNKGEDTASLILKYPDKIVNIQVTYSANGQPWSETRSIWGEYGCIHTKIESENPIEVSIQNKQVQINVQHHGSTWWQDSVIAGIHHALDNFSSGDEFSVTPVDARNALKVIQYAYRSENQNRTVYMDEKEY